MACIAFIAAIVYAPVLDQQPPTFALQAYFFEVRDTASDFGVAEVLLEVEARLASPAFAVNRIIQAVAYQLGCCNSDQRLQNHRVSS